MKKSHNLFADKATDGLLKLIADVTGIEKKYLVGDDLEDVIKYLFHVAMLSKQVDDAENFGFNTDAVALRVFVHKKFRRKFRNSRVLNSNLREKLARYLQMHLKVYNRA